MIQQAITFERNNHFSDNAYIGDWSFVAYDRTLPGGFTEWRSPPFYQDARSTKE